MHSRVRRSFCAMRIVKVLFDFYLEASIHVALAATALTGATVLLAHLPWNVPLLAFVFFSTVVCYNLIRYGVKTNTYFVVSKRYRTMIQPCTLICLGFALYFLSRFSVDIWVAVAVLSLLSILYAVPLSPRTRTLRRWVGLKIYIVALVWTGVTAGLPLIASHYSMRWDLWVLVVQRFILIVALMIPFEIRDLPQDDTRLRTLPQVLGVQNTQRLGVVLALAFLVLTFLKQEVTSSEIGMRAVLSVLLVWVCSSAHRMQFRYFAAFWVEGIPIGWLGVLALAECYF